MVYMYMDSTKIGAAEKNTQSLSQEGGVAFSIQYGHDKYGITLSDEELDMMLLTGFVRAMSRNPRAEVFGASYRIDLEHPDLPVFARVASLRCVDETGISPDISMQVGISSQSQKKKHLGLLSINRFEGASGWVYARYDTQHLEHLDALFETPVYDIAA